ncbi:uncharacterized protein F4822DRAFT_241951 [Hypoxylon trugodes]|uniref:uncharacterized protein n=1 Tax=Hypoxylon trugodes TaxID=326681 RepID=UPI00219A96B4|nr:uncharacterized protein F4822DRAFT_241951 [Hypoxylon trugodes]KAI1388315.1 hypothetical protein F4822DRAFT_241951 [Hypoxylon trugodes]
MVKSEFKEWWKSQTVHPSRLQPTVPICPCAACFNGTGHDQEVFRDPIDPREVPLKKKKVAVSTSISEKFTGEKPLKKPWYKSTNGLTRKPSSASMASDLAPLCAASTTQSTQSIQ